MSHLGSDFSCVEDLDPNLTPVEGRLGLAQAVARRLITPTGGLFYAPDYGDDTRRYLNNGGGSGSIEQRAAATAEGESEKDERVNRADAEADITGETLDLTVQITDDDGPFTFTLNVSDLSAELLLEEQGN